MNLRFHLSFATVALLIVAAGARAQLLPNAAPEQSSNCSGPLGALMPECEAAKGSSDRGGGAPSHRTPPGASVPPTVRVPARPSAAGPAQPPETPHDPPPQSATEFQRFAASSVGEVLPIFGASLFEHVPTTFAPLDRVPVTADYVVGPGDEILVRVWGQVNLDLELTVDRAGAVFIPQVGNVGVAGLRFQQVPDFLRARLERIFRNFDINVNMGQLRSVEIFVVGQVRRPGTYTVSSLSTLVNALFASGGPSAQGSMRRIQLKREGKVATEFDLYDLLLKGDKSKDVRLLPGDVVYIPPAGPQIALAGSVKNPAIYELNGEKTAGDVFQLAGGLSSVADAQRVTLERIHERTSLEIRALRLDAAGLATPVGEGDVLHVLTITPRFANAITLRGNVANPGRFPWHQGMRLRNIIPDKQSLVTRDYWTKRNVLGFAAQADDITATPPSEGHRSLSRTNIESIVPEINWSYAIVERQSARDLSTELIAFHPGKLILERDETQNLPLLPGDVVTIFSQADIRVAAAQQTRFIRLEGEIQAAGVYAVGAGETLGQVIQRAGGLTPQAYLFGAELLRDSTREDQQRRIDQFTRELDSQVEQSATLRLTAPPARKRRRPRDQAGKPAPPRRPNAPRQGYRPHRPQPGAQRQLAGEAHGNFS